MFVLKIINVYNFYIRFIYEPGQSNTFADETADGTQYSPEQGWGTACYAHCLYGANGAVA